VRLAFAVAAHLEPEILILDEVLAVGDSQFQKKCLGKMKSVSEDSGRTILFVSHNMNAIEQLCTRAILLENGRVTMRSDNVRKVTKEYLFGQANQVKKAEWSNPGGQFCNPYFEPLKVSICDKDGNPLPMPVSNDIEMFIRIEGKVRELEPGLEIGYAIYSEDGILLYWTCHTDVQEERWPQVRLGRNVFVSKIPSRLFNEGVYRIDLIGALHVRKWLFEPGVRSPSLFLTIQGGLSESPHWMNVRPGVLAPVNEWQVTMIGD